MPSTIDILDWSSLTAFVNETKSPNSFIKDTFFSTHEVKSTEKIELSIIYSGRKIAPFVRKNGEGILVDGTTEEFDTVEAPNIRIKRALNASELFFKRRPGTVVFPTTSEQISAGNAYVDRQAQRMSDMVSNAEEWLCAMATRGVIAYSHADEENFTITFPRPSENNVTLTTGWDDVDPSLPTPEEDFFTAKELLHNAVGLGMTDAIMGRNAAAAFRRMLMNRESFNRLYVRSGELDLNQQFARQGVLFLGTFSGVRCWQYSRTADLNGVDTPMIRDDYVEFVANVPEAENVLYYGAIPDVKLFGSSLFVAERFAKSWDQEDPSVRILLLHSRPLPVPRRPGSFVSMQVTNI